jgi:hypothetical protein
MVWGMTPLVILCGLGSFLFFLSGDCAKIFSACGAKKEKKKRKKKN